MLVHLARWSSSSIRARSNSWNNESQPLDRAVLKSARIFGCSLRARPLRLDLKRSATARLAVWERPLRKVDKVFWERAARHPLSSPRRGEAKASYWPHVSGDRGLRSSAAAPPPACAATPAKEKLALPPAARFGLSTSLPPVNGEDVGLDGSPFEPHAKKDALLKPPDLLDAPLPRSSNLVWQRWGSTPASILRGSPASELPQRLRPAAMGAPRDLRRPPGEESHASAARGAAVEALLGVLLEIQSRMAATWPKAAAATAYFQQPDATATGASSAAIATLTLVATCASPTS